MTATTTKTMGMSFEPLTMHTRHPFGISYGTSQETKNVLVKLQYDNHIGYGEAAPASYHGESRETVMTVLAKFQECQSELFGDPFAIAATTARMDKIIAGHAAAKSAIEMAMHDLAGKIAGLSTRRMLGLFDAPQAMPMTDFTIGIDSLDMIEKKTEEALAAGHKLLKVKLGTSYDREIIEKVRKVAAHIPLRVDANGGWSPKEAVEKAKFLAEHNIEFIEQPLPKFAHKEDFAFVKEHSPVMIFADESICKASDVARLAGAIDGVVVKLAKSGGLLEAIRIISTARAHSLKVMFGMMIESSIGVTAAAQLASLCDYLDLDGALLLRDDPFIGAVWQDGYMMPNDKPGLGVSPRNTDE
ncbi:MAG: L-Ala-D/L-Glu epimerase [bacterium ADurb.Bin425]|nr:MAG: L-Ala-D/L-Glu epimerase [bacterium ADurb.Bin425]